MKVRNSNSFGTNIPLSQRFLLSRTPQAHVALKTEKKKRRENHEVKEFIVVIWLAENFGEQKGFVI